MNATSQSVSSSEEPCFHKLVLIHDDFVVSDYFFKVLATIINFIACPLIIVLNALVITAIKTKPRLQTMHNILLACLAVTDLVIGVAAQPAFITEEIIVMVAGSSSFACKLDNILQLSIICLCLLSLLHLALLSIERFVAMKYSLRYEEIVTKFRLIVAVGCCWVFITLFFFLRIFKLRAFPPFIILFLSFPVIIFCHTYVYFICRRHEIQIQSEQVSQEATAKFLKEKKACKTTSIIIGGVLMCYLPGVLIGILPGLFSGYLIKRLEVSSRPLLVSFQILNSLCNPIIYCWRNKEIREASMQLLKKIANGSPN